MNQTDFNLALEEIYHKGGTPEVIAVPGLGVIHWTKLSAEEKAYVTGWLECRKFYKEKLGE